MNHGELDKLLQDLGFDSSKMMKWDDNLLFVVIIY